MELETGLEIKDFISLINGRVSATINRHLNRKFKGAGLGITTEQWSVLTCLWEKDKQTQQYICNHTFKDRASITRLIDILEKNGMVIRVSDPGDRRINLVHLTEKGAELEEEANTIIKDSIELATKDVDKKEFMILTSVFKTIIRNIED
ncbi:MAG: MarR family transcriptional regulator [Bacteroidales bacterium]